MKNYLVYILLSLFTISCMQFRKSDKNVKEKFETVGVDVQIIKTEVDKRNIRYVKTGNSSNRLIVFIHGAPGSSQDYYQFLQDSALLKKFTMISVDRPGYGYSDFGESVESIIIQSKIINTAIQSELNKYDSIIFIGHSYGGPIAAYISIMNSEKHVKLIMLAPANDPKEEKVFWFTHLAMIPPFSWLTPKAFTVAADEKFSHAKALEQIETSWKEINFNVIHVHGTKDILVPFKTVEFSKKNIQEKYLKIIELKDVNHFLPWSHTELIKDLILENEIVFDQKSD